MLTKNSDIHPGLRPAVGIINGLILAAIFWVAVGLIIWIVK